MSVELSTTHEFARQNGKEILESGYMRNATLYADWIISNTLSLYPRQHRVAQYAENLLKRLDKPEDHHDYRIDIYKGPANAFVLPNGHIFMSDELLLMADSEEEVHFVNNHEKAHVRGNHAIEVAARIENMVNPTIKNILDVVGVKRLHEWESDIRSFLDLDKEGINPSGGIQFLDKLRKISRGGYVHGKTTDRVLNLQTATHMTDLPSLDLPLTPIPDDIKRYVRSEASNRNLVSSYERLQHALKERRTDLLQTTLRTLSPNEGVLALPALLDDLERTKKLSKSSQSAKMWSTFQEHAVASIAEKVFKDLKSKLPSTVTDQQAVFLYYALLDMVVESNATDPQRTEALFNYNPARSSVNNAWDITTYGFSDNLMTPEDLNVLLSSLSPELFGKLKLVIKHQPDTFVKNLLDNILEQQLLHDKNGKLHAQKYVQFGSQLLSRLYDLYNEYGMDSLDGQEILSIIHDATEGELPLSEQRDVYDRLTELLPSHDKLGSDVLRDDEQDNLASMKRMFIGFADEIREARRDYYDNLDEKKESEKNESPSDFARSSICRTLIEDHAEIISEVFEQQSLSDDNTFLRFLGLLQKEIARDISLNKYIDIRETQWASVLYEALLVRENTLGHGEDTSIERLLFRAKALLLTSQFGEAFELDQLASSIRDEMKQSKDFSPDDYAELYRFVTDTRFIAQEIGLDIHTRELIEDSEWVQTLKSGKYSLIRKFLKGKPGKQKFNDFIRDISLEYSFSHYGDEFYEPEEIRNKSKLLSDIFHKFDFDLSVASDIRTLYYLSTHMHSINLAVRMQNILLPRLNEAFTFDEGMQFYSEEIRARRMMSYSSFQQFIEGNARTHEELDKARTDMLDLFTYTSEENFGKLVAAEAFMDRLLDDKPSFLIAAIGNGRDDRLLKEYLYDRWKITYDVSETLADNINLNTFTQNITKLDAQGRFVLLRDLLAGDNGVLTGKIEDRMRLVDHYLSTYVEAANEEEEQMLSGIKEVLQEFVRKADYSDLYFALAPLLQDRVFRSYSESVPWETVVRESKAPRKFLTLEYDDDFNPVYRSEMKKSDVKEIVDLIMQRNRRKDDSYENEKEYVDPQRNVYESLVSSLFEPYEQVGPVGKQRVSEFILHVAQTMRAPGTRSAQLLGHYVSLSPDLEEAFKDVFDNVPGQSKVSGHLTVSREWDEFRTELTGLHERLGNGSLMNVFATESALTGEERVIKVLNPNARYHTDRTVAIMRDVFTTMAEKYPEYEPAVGLIEDIAEWIRGDISYEGFLEDDTRFRSIHDKYTLGGQYSLEIPISYGPENPYFKQEETIPGRNLTETSTLINEGHDVKEIARLICTNFLTQILDGQVHSNLHPGNIRVTPDNRVALLDRNFYLKLTPDDQSFLFNLAQSGTDAETVTEHCISYVNALGQHITHNQVNAIKDNLRANGNIVDTVKRMQVTLRKQGVEIPLRMTLIAQNLYYLETLAKKAGFTGFMQAVSA